MSIKNAISRMCLVVCLVSIVSGCGVPQTSEEDTILPTVIETENQPTQTVFPESRIGRETLQYPGKNEEYEYSVYETYVEIDDYFGDNSNVVVPEIIDGLPVKVIYGFCFNETVKSITLPSTIVIIQNCAFDSCSNLETINIPDGVEEIGWNAFYDCWSLESLTIPKSVTKIGEMAFGIGRGKYGGYKLIENLTVRFYKGTAAAKYIADCVFDINYEIIDAE